MNYIGVDCHISTLDFAVVNGIGNLKKKARVKTSVKGFMGFIKTVPKPRKIYLKLRSLAHACDSQTLSVPIFII